MTRELTHRLPPGAIEWLQNGERGMSSEAIFCHLTGIPITRRLSPPCDPGDLRRCRMLLAQVPEFRARLDEMKTVSSAWAALVSEWDLLCSLADTEPRKAYERMEKLVLGKSRAR